MAATGGGTLKGMLVTHTGAGAGRPVTATLLAPDATGTTTTPLRAAVTDVARDGSWSLDLLPTSSAGLPAGAFWTIQEPTGTGKWTTYHKYVTAPGVVTGLTDAALVGEETGGFSVPAVIHPTATAGGAGTVPATVKGYLPVTFADGTVGKIPIYGS